MYKLLTLNLMCLFFTAPVFAQTMDDSGEPYSKDEPIVISNLGHETQKAAARWQHAKELVGKNYTQSVVKAGESIITLDDHVYQWTQKSLQKYGKTYSDKVAKTILEESARYRFDPIFLLAVIENESSFNPLAVGPIGELGLMQVTKETAGWIAKKYNLPWTAKSSLRDPVKNIQIGSAYLSYLREKFMFKGQLYLAAYNMGAGNVLKFMTKQIWPKIYPVRVMTRYTRFYTELKSRLDKQNLSKPQLASSVLRLPSHL